MLTRLYVRFRMMLEADEGATAVEYGLMVAGIAVVIILAVWALGGSVRDLFNDVAAEINGAGG